MSLQGRCELSSGQNGGGNASLQRDMEHHWLGHCGITACVETRHIEGSLGCRGGYSWPYGLEWPQELGSVFAPSNVSMLLLHPSSASLPNTATVAFIGSRAAIALFECRLLTVWYH